MADDPVIVLDLLACLSAEMSAFMLLAAVWRVVCGRFPAALAAGGLALLAACVPGLWWGAGTGTGAVVMFALTLVGLGPAVMVRAEGDADA
ncbi:hypothetical protein ACLUWS_03150 [Bifidobacterium boum]|uniref:hypothetical protein n=1 Tax=Bifidobacterium boum TaxID=78343 RepID=UPI0039934547